MDDKLMLNLKIFVQYENDLKSKFKEKTDIFYYKATWEDKIDSANELWQKDEEVHRILDELIKLSEEINNSFLEYKLIDVLKLFYFFISLHEQVYYDDHPLTELIKKQRGYSFWNTSGYLINRYEEIREGKNPKPNNSRVEMCLTYLLILLSRVYFGFKPKNNPIPLDLPLRTIIKNNISISDLSHEKSQLLSVLERGLKDNLKQESDIEELFNTSLQTFIDFLSVSAYLKGYYKEDWQILRPSFFEINKGGWTTKVMMCRIYQPVLILSEFPFGDIEPKGIQLIE